MKTRMKLKMWSIIVFSLLTNSVLAQHSIQGNVKSSTGESLPGAKIQLAESYLGAISNAEGVYSISQLKSGKYVLKIKLMGYENQEKEVEITNSNVELDWTLNPSALMMEEVYVSTTRANASTPTTFTNLDKEAIQAANFGQDLPYLLEGTPSTVVSSDAGAGVGYTGIRIRGVDPTRTNVTINGIPINDAESHGVFWVNMPDLASSVENIQVQRGVGTSSNGGAAFGSSINIKSDAIQRNPYGEFDNSIGSFNTRRNTIKAGTGLMKNGFSMDARLSNIQSNGYIDRASSNLSSVFLAVTWVGKNSMLKATSFSGVERTYQAWYGTPEAVIKGDDAAKNEYADRNWLTDSQRQNLLTSGRTYNFYEYANEVDNYQQDHSQLHFTHTFSPKLNMMMALHYTRGRGYYEQFREQDELSRYGLLPVIMGGDTITNSDIIRRRWLDNHFYGTVFNVNYSNLKGLNITTGGGINAYDGDHFGEIIWAQYASNSSIYDEYYRNNAFKLDANIYAKATYEYKKFTGFLDAQFRYIDYTFLGIDDVSNAITDLEQRVTYPFFNPKGGFMYKVNDKNVLYASYSIAHREPVRADFRENTPENRPKHEQLRNLEAGHKLSMKKFFLNSNVFWMDYSNQLILTGQINDVGGYTRTNVDKSYRLGLELETGYRITKKLNVSANAMLAQNKVKEFVEYIDNYDTYIQEEIVHKNTDLAFSPNVIVGMGLNYEPVNNLRFNLLLKHVGKQFLDNTSDDSRSLNAYSFGNISAFYTFNDVWFKEIQLGLLVNNFWNTMYENNGYTFSYIYDSRLITENFYYPQAGRNFLLRAVFKL
jgi:iron complex outermembrane recepter protein